MKSSISIHKHSIHNLSVINSVFLYLQWGAPEGNITASQLGAAIEMTRGGPPPKGFKQMKRTYEDDGGANADFLDPPSEERRS